jgi:hypothetical protein
MGLKEFIDDKNAALAELEKRHSYRGSAYKAGKLAVEHVKAAGKAKEYDHHNSGENPWRFVQTPFVALEDGSRVAIRRSEEKKISNYSLKGFDLMVELSQGSEQKYAHAARWETNWLQRPIEYTDGSTHQNGYDEAVDCETVAAFEAVATAMERLPVGAESLE